MNLPQFFLLCLAGWIHRNQQHVTRGYTRLQGALRNVGHQIGRGTIGKVLKEAGVDPAPGRKNGTTWKEFLRTHWEVLAAADFFNVEVWTAWFSSEKPASNGRHRNSCFIITSNATTKRWKTKFSDPSSRRCRKWARSNVEVNSVDC